MAATKAMNLYITTCRYVIQSNPHDPETWTELHRYLPYLRQSLSCCVCAQFLHIPMGPVDTPCQHHVCKGCIGGKMRFKPSCAWCKNYDEFVENQILRTVIQCVKKLCEYLASSGIIDLSGTNTLVAAIQDGVHIKDDCNTISPSHLGPFPPTLHKVGSRRGSKEETSKQLDRQVSFSDKSESRPAGIIPLTDYENDEDNLVTGDHEDNPTNGDKFNAIPTLERESKALDTKKKKRKRLGKLKCTKASGRIGRTKQDMKLMPDIRNNMKNEPVHGLYETVASEHGYNKDVNTDNQNSILKVRIRKVEGDHECLVRKTRTTEPVPPGVTGPLHDTTDSVTNGSMVLDDNDNSSFEDSLNFNNNSLIKDNIFSSGDEKVSPRNRLSLKKKHIGCRCGMATPNPGKLTCCGQRCPCYSAFKGCVDCKCRGCRNPRGDTPAPHSLKSQLQSQCIQPQSLISLGTNPQIILTPIKLEREDEHESDMDIEV